MDPGQAISREGLQQTIDAEIKSLEESVLALKLRRNALSPVSSLPPEVFIAIFSLLCIPGTSPSPDGGTPDSDYHLTRLRVSHVCHHWREIALDQPLLWSHVDFFAQRGTAEILVRAKSAPLYLEASASVSGHRWDDVRFNTFRKELQARVAYICHLRTCADPFHLQSTLKGLVSPAPILEYLSLSSHTGHTRPHRRSGSRPSLRRCPIPDTLFSGSTPRLSYLELRSCNISWKSPLLKGLKHLEIIKPSADARPDLTVWLDTLDEMPQLKTLILHWASPIAPPLPFRIERAITLPSLTRFDISASSLDCALALSHLDLPALTSLCLSAITSHPQRNDVQILVPYIARHAHGPQDTQPLQSAHIRSESNRTIILAWPVPDIDVKVYNQPTTLDTTLPTRVAISIVGDEWLNFDQCLEILDLVLEGLPMDSLAVLAAHELKGSRHDGDLPTQDFWQHHSPKWPLLKRVLLSPHAARGFMNMLLKDDGGRENPLLPSLTELVMADFSLYSLSLLPLKNVLHTRVEQGVPVGRLDLRMCRAHSDGRSDGWLRSLSKFVVDVMAPEKSSEVREQIEFLWKTVACGPFVDYDDVLSESSGGFRDDESI